MSRRAVAFLALWFVVGCEDPAPVIELQGVGRGVLQTWDEAFVATELKLESPGREVLTLTQVVVGRNGDLYLPAGSGKPLAILHYSPGGRLLNQIPIQDAEAFSAFDVAPNDSMLFVFEPLQQKMLVLTIPDGDVVRSFELPNWPSVIVPLRDGSVVTYAVAGDRRDRVLERYSNTGERLTAGYEVPGQALRIFHGRIHSGGAISLADGSLLALHPNLFQLVRLSSDLKVMEILRPAEQGSRWTPDPPPFPDDLNPYEYQPPHQAWWDSFLHIGRLFSLTADLVLVSVWQSKGLADVENFANIYSTAGAVIAEGLKVPHDGRIVGAGSNRVFVVRNASMADGGGVQPLALYVYTLRQHMADKPQPHGVGR